MITLGWHGALDSEWERSGYGFALHDSAAAVLVDGEIVAAIEEERLNRVKHSNAFPERAIEYCLKKARVDFAEIDQIAIGLDETYSDRIAATNFLNDPETQDWFKSVSNPKEARTARSLFASLFRKNFGSTVNDKLRFVSHHTAHAAGAYHLSGYHEALVVCFDGDGDGLSGLIAEAKGGHLKVLKTFDEAQSLGGFYRFCIALLGYQIFDEYKVMGLAPFGDPARYDALFSSFYKLLPGGNYQLLDQQTMLKHFIEAGLDKHVRSKGEKFDKVHKDIAAAVQNTLEHIMMHVISYYRQETGIDSICLTGGVAHNSTFNGKLYYSNLFRKVFVLPFSHDAGNAVGAALAVYHEDNDHSQKSQKLDHVFFGTDVGDNEKIRSELARWGAFVEARLSENVIVETARLLVDDQVIAWVQGRAEFGPRALGNRSIIADPRPATNKERINRMIKKREGYRPFAPSVKLEAVDKYFETAKDVDADLSFMNFVLSVRKAHRETLGAITHVDGTGRLQTVKKTICPRYWGLLDAFENETEVPILLNTSLNNHAEPIVNSVSDALACFLTTELNYLVVGDYVVSRVENLQPSSVFETFSVSIRRSQKLTMGVTRNAEGTLARACHIESNASAYFSKPRFEISRTLYDILAQAPETLLPITQLLPKNIGEAEKAELLHEILGLWGERALRLIPSVSAVG